MLEISALPGWLLLGKSGPPFSPYLYSEGTDPLIAPITLSLVVKSRGGEASAISDRRMRRRQNTKPAMLILFELAVVVGRPQDVNSWAINPLGIQSTIPCLVRRTDCGLWAYPHPRSICLSSGSDDAIEQWTERRQVPRE